MLDKEIVRLTARYVAGLLVAQNCNGAMPKRPEGVSFRAVFVFAKRHAVASAIWYMIEDEVRAEGDAELTERFEKACMLDYTKHRIQASEFSAVCNAFGRAGINYLPLKGFINKSLWEKPEYRTMTDMDISVSPDDISAAGELLKSLGYTLDHEGSSHDSYEKPPYVNIELHKKLDNGEAVDFSRLSTVDGDPHHYRMSNEDFLIYALLHMYKHYRQGGSGMRSFFDVYLYLKKKGAELDFDYIQMELRRHELDEFYSSVLRLCELWFDGRTECAEELSELEIYIATGGTFGTVENRVEHALGNKSTLGYALSRIFLPYRSMKHIYKWLKPLPFLLPVAWVLRLVRALFDGRMRREIRATKAAADKTAGIEPSTDTSDELNER